ncbi:MAG: phosphate ABC transporter substrate-binding protein [Oscillospiraceae bacterium]|nr:phosphate ABC transporter substrate-binding protein [Oscillospiraceae bacterium]
MKRNVKKISVILCAVAMAAVIAGCAGQTQSGAPATTPPPMVTTEAPQEIVVENPTIEATQILFDGSSTLAPVIATIAAELEEQSAQPIEVYVSSGGSGQGISAIINQTANFGMLARDLRESEREQIPYLQEYLIGIDALTVAINPENPLAAMREGLTTEEIVRIFSGQYATWQDFDPALPDEEIVVVVRDIGGGAHEVFQTNIMGDVDVRADAIQAPSMGALINRVIENRNAIGYASFGVSYQNQQYLAFMEVDGVAPNVENILNGTYIIQRPLILISSGQPSEAEQYFLDAIFGDMGQGIIEEIGFIPMS